MSKSRARLLAELLNTEGRVKKDRSDLAGADSVIDLDNLPTITNAKLENSSISVAGHSVSLGGSVSLDTADITEHTDYPYFTNARARGAISVDGSLSYNSSTGVLSYTTPTTIASLSNHDTDDLAEGTNLYFTNARARGAISVSGDLAYNSTTGVVSFTERTDAEVRGLVSASGNLSYNSSTGVFSYTTPTTIASLSNHDTDDLAEGANLYFTNARARAAVSASTGSAGYTSSTGVFTIPSTSDHITEGSNQFFTNARARSAISASGSLSYNSSTGVISYTQPTNISTFTNDSSYITNSTASLDASKITGGTLNFARIPYPVNGDWWNNGYVRVGTDGVMEVGKYLDFHTADSGGGTDYDVRITASSGAIDIDGDLTVDDITAGAISATSYSGTLASSVTGTTQSASDNSTKVATTAYVDSAVSGIVDSAPGTLNTLNELAAALGDDANFSTTVTNSIATKLPLAGGTVTGNLYSTSTASNAIHTRFIAGAANASTADGPLYLQYGKSQDISMFEASGANRKLYIYGNDNGTDRWGGLSIASDGSFTVQASDTYLILQASSYIQSNNPHNFTSSLLTSGTVWLDSSRNATFANLTATGSTSLGNISSNGITVASGHNVHLTNGNVTIGDYGNTNTGTLFLRGSTANKQATLKATNGNLHIDSNAGNNTYINYYTGSGTYFGSGAGGVVAVMGPDGDLWKGSADNSGSKYWHAGNDGSGSGLDADLLDGHDSGSFLRSNVSDNYTSGTLSFNSGTALKMLNGSNFDASSGDVYVNLRVIRNAGTANTDGLYIGYLNSNSGLTRIFGGGQGSGGIYITGSGANDIKYNNSSVFWHAGNDGSGTGLDADLLDGAHGSSYLRSDQSDSMSGELNVTRNGGVTGTSAPQYSDVNIELQTSNNHVPGISFHRGGYSATTLYEYDGELYVNAWTTRNQTGKLVSFGNDGSGSGLDADLLDGLQGSSYWQKSGSWYGDLGSNGYDRVQGVNYTGGEFVLVEKNAQMSTLIDGDYFAYESGGFFSSSSSAYGDLSGFKAYDTSTIQVQQKDGGNANLRVTGSITRAGNTVWDSGNDGAGSGLDADTVDGYQYTNHEGVGDYQVFLVNGDTDKYYPVVITGGAGHSSDFKIWRGYNEYGPDDWNSSTHKGGLTFRYRISGSSGWGGYPNRIKVLEAEEIYTTLLGGINYTAHTMKHVVWLRGGGTNGARYHISSTSDFSLAIYTDTSSGYTSGSGWLVYDSTNNTYDVYEDYRTLTQRNAAIEGEVYNTMPVTYGTGQVRHVLAGTQPSKTYWNSSNDGSGSGVDADLLDGVQGSSFLRSDANDTASGQYSFTKTNDHAIKVGTIRGTAVGSQSGEYIHMYERVHIGGPSGWGASVSAAPSYGISTYGGADLAVNQGTVRVTTGTIASSDASTRGLIMDGNYTNGQYRHRWRKQDNGGGVPLYLDYAAGTANSYTQIARFGPYTSNPEQFEVYGAMKTNGQIVINQNIASPSNYYNGLQMEVRATSGTAGIGLHRNGYSHVGIYTNSTNRLDFDFNSGDVILMYNAGTLWGSGNDGSGSGLDADTVDGIQGSSILQTGTNFGGDVSGTYNAIVVANNSHEHSQLYENAGITYGASYLQWLDNNGTGGTGLSGSSPANGFSDWHHHLVMNHGNSGGYYSNLQCSFHSDRIHYRRLVNGSLQGAVELFHTGNDGSGSGLDADLLDGQHKAYFEMPTSPLTQNGNMNNVSAPAGQYASVQFYNMYTPSGSGNQSNYNVPEDGGSHYHVQQFNGYSNSYNNWKYQIAHSFYNGKMYHRNQYDTTWQGWATVWDSDTDGAGSGLDADLLDGQQGSYYNWRTWNDHITWNTGQNIYVSGESSIDVSGSGYFQVWDSGTGAPFIKCDVGQTVEIGQAGSRGLYVYGSITASGNVTAYSDIRLKENIEVIPNALEKVNQIRGVTFTRNDQDDKEARHTGVIAQEVEKVLPEVISEDNLGIKNVAYGNMVGLLIEAVKELKQEVDDLKAQLKEK